MKKIYIVLTYTGTFLSNVIKRYTRDEYCHCSIALDEKLEEMYSFGRINAYNPFIAGFIKEEINEGTYKRFGNTKTSIYSFEITEEQYCLLKEIIDKMKENKEAYKYNFLGLLAIIFHINLKRENHYYCSQFVKELLDSINVDFNLPQITRPEDFKSIQELKLEYKGLLNKYDNK